jgi:hypothetical protein
VIHQVGADAGEVVNRFDADGNKVPRRSDAGAEQQRRGVVGASRHHHPARSHLFATRHDHAGSSARVVQEHVVDQRVRAELEVAARPGGGNVCQQHALALAALEIARQGPDPDRPGAVLVVDELMAQLPTSGDKKPLLGAQG